MNLFKELKEHGGECLIPDEDEQHFEAQIIAGKRDGLIITSSAPVAGLVIKLTARGREVYGLPSEPRFLDKLLAFIRQDNQRN